MEKPFFDKKIGVLMGGWSGEREVSLRSGAGVVESLRKQGYNAVGIDVDHQIDINIRNENIDIAFIVLHGEGGEDGVIQGMLEAMNIPYTGSGVTASALSMNKELTKLVLLQHGLPTPPGVYLDSAIGLGDRIEAVKKQIGIPAVIKPLSEGSSLGVSIAHDEAELEKILAESGEKYPRIMVEKFIKGRDITVGIIGPESNVRALPILEMEPKNEFYDYEAKYTAGLTNLICPARISDAATRAAQELAVKTHLALGCHGVSRVDFVISDDESLNILEINTIPGMTVTSDLPEEISAEGGSYDSLVLEILSSATIDR
ncbi:MAG TPA: D-alanine--D-alanine ligase [bacterium]|nr:D-alanine--D-alanine ligase [bacterium]